MLFCIYEVKNMSEKLTGLQLFLKPVRAFSLLVVLSFVLTLAGAVTPVRAAPQAAAGDLDQCRNGTLASPADCVAGTPPLGWVNGNANGTQAHWTEGQSIPYRIRLTGLTNGQHELTIRYDYTAPTGEHAFDYLTTFNRSAPSADPCSDFLIPCPAPATFPIPVDPVLATCSTPQHDPVGGGVPQLPGDFTIYNGTITDAAYVGTHTCHDSAIQVSMIITFTSTAPDTLIAWSAHIAPEFDWGNGESAHSISGAPYHMTFIDLDGSGGNQDRSMMTNAVYATNISTTVSDTDLTVMGPVFDTATIEGFQGSTISTDPVLAGTLNFYICADTVAPYAAPFTSGCDHSSGTLLTAIPITVNGNGSYQSPDYTPTQNGYYCFRAEFTPAEGSPYPFARESNTSKVNPLAECFLVNDPLPVTLSSLQAGGADAITSFFLVAAATLLIGLSFLVMDGRLLGNRK